MQSMMVSHIATILATLLCSDLEVTVMEELRVILSNNRTPLINKINSCTLDPDSLDLDSFI